MHLATFVHDQPLDLACLAIERVAVRGVLFRGDELLLLGSRHGDYKFPGGGVEPGETLQTALQREFLEECGLREVAVGERLGDTVEYARSADPAYEVFKMTSHYFACTSRATPTGVQQLETYEANLELEPRWVTVEQALEANRAVLASGVGVMRWLTRETKALEMLFS
ncbi:NUDIX domain-containing protein [Kribbella sp. CA-293567]|uniref:NUDIX domain-containing protein n=1 Tax=Kribbella sp. CA-293567 TaxID=3002436 RepID=UPI0022DDFF73|nr:NUDIX domain-containing protein [Kribbella sp. CA-293567]WBQ02459.1 NUDIX domain-containing protein [Kribbella sp. CA-293567]